MRQSRHTRFEVSTITCNEEMKGNAKCKNFRFEPPFGRLRGNAHGSSTVYVKHVVDFLLAIIELFFASCQGWGAISGYWSKLWCWKWGGSHWAQISGEGWGRSSTNDSWRQKTRVPGLSRGVVCVMLRLAVLIQYRRVTDRHTTTANKLTRASLAPRRY